MPAKRRSDDPTSEDHIIERKPFLDWRAVAPRWVLITLLVFSFGVNGLLGTMVLGLATERIDGIERANSDQKWDIIARHGVILAELSVKVKQHDDDLKRIFILDARIADMQADLKVLLLD